MTHTSAMQKAREVKMRNLLLGIETPAMRGDCLGVVLASCFEPHVESDEMDDSDTWKQGAIDAANEVANAIIEQFAAALISETAAKDAEIERLKAALSNRQGAEQKPATCVACEDDPKPPNVPCAVCGRETRSRALKAAERQP